MSIPRSSARGWRPSWAWACLWACAALGAWPAPLCAQEVGFWESLLDADRRRLDEALGRAVRALGLGDAEGLDLAVEQAALLAPDEPSVACLRAALARLRGQPQEARQRLEALRRDPAAVAALPPGLLEQEWGLALAELGELDEARAALERATLEDPSSAARWMALGDLRLRQGDHEPAMVAWSHAARRAPEAVGPLLGAALTRELQGSREEARGWLLAALLRRPEPAEWIEQAPLGWAGDRAWLRALLAEELGRPDEARAWLGRAEDEARRGGSPHLVGMRALGERLDKAGPVVVGQGRLPVWRPSAAALSPQGRALALGDGLGRLLVMDPKADKLVASPSLAGPAVVDLAWTPEGVLALYDHGWVGVYDPGRGFALRRGVGPVAAPSGLSPRALSRDGEAALTAQPNSWTVVLLSSPNQERALPFNLAGAQAVALGPWSASRDGGVVVALLNTQFVQRWSLSPALSAEAQTVAAPRPVERPGRLSEAQAQAVALTPEGRSVLLAGPRHVAVLRASDLSPVRYVDLGEEAALGEAAVVVPDPDGLAGFGPCALVLHERRFRAVRLEPGLLR